MKSALLFPLFAAALYAAASAPVGAANNDLCRNVHFQFVNKHQTGKTIRVEGVEYLNVVNNRRVTVSFVPVDCDFNQTCVVPRAPYTVDLKDIEGNDVKDIRFVYREQDRQNNFMEPWSRGAGPFNDRHRECRADRTYGQQAAFEITGTLAPTRSRPNPADAAAAATSLR